MRRSCALNVIQGVNVKLEKGVHVKLEPGVRVKREHAAGAVEAPVAARVNHAPSDYARWGKLGAKWGTFGAEYGRLGGRPRLIDLKVGGLVAGTSNRKKLSYKQKREDCFGVFARIEVCDICHELWPAFEKAGKSKVDLYL